MIRPWLVSISIKMIKQYTVRIFIVLVYEMSHLMKIWYFSSSVNSFFKRAYAAIPMGLDVWILVRSFVYFHTLYVRTVKALARLRRRAGSPEPSLVAYVISTIISWAGSNDFPYKCIFIWKIKFYLAPTTFFRFMASTFKFYWYILWK